MNNDKDLKPYTLGSFAIPAETREILNCEDFTEKRGFRINAKPEKKPRSTDTGSKPQKQKKKEPDSKNIFQKIFGKKKK